MPLDLSRLANVRPSAEGHQAACPACREQNGGDSKGDHLRVWKSGRWSCVVDQSPEHNRAIWQLAGDGGADGVTLDLSPPHEPQLEIERTWPASSLAGLIADHSYWAGRGVPEEIMASLRGGVATKGQLANRHVLPVFNDDGLVHGFAGRALRPGMLPKYKHIGKVSSWVWGDLAGIEETGRAILVESPGDRLALDARGVPGALVLWGVNLSQSVLAYLIAANPRDIVIATNNDVKAHAAGQRAAAKIARTLAAFFDPGTVRVVLPGPKDLLDQHWTDGALNDEAWAEWAARLDPVEPSTEADEQDAPAEQPPAGLDDPINDALDDAA